MRRKIFALMVGSLVLLSVLAGYYVGYVTAQFTFSASPLANSPCSTPVSPSPVIPSQLLEGSGMTDVYQLTPGSVGEICVTYKFSGTGIYSFASPDYGPWTSLGYCACSCDPKWDNGTAATLCAGFDVTPSRGLLIHFPGESISVEYTVQAEQNTTGLFELFITSCNAVPIAVGTIPASVPIEPLECMCCVGTFGPQNGEVVGVSNMYVALAPWGTT